MSLGRGVSAALVLLFVLAVGSPLAGQAVGLKRDLPVELDRCGMVQGLRAPAGSAAAQGEAERLSREASRAMVLGDLARSRTLLEEAAALSPTAPGIRFQLGQVLEELGEIRAAVEAFCRHLELAPPGPDRLEAASRVDRLVGRPEGGPSDRAAAAFRAGIARFDAGDYAGAVGEFSRALVELPDWDAAYFNRGLAYLQAGSEPPGRQDLRRYLELNPGATDAPLVQDILSPPPRTRTGPHPAAALAAGVLFPGMGHFYVDRPVVGALFLAGAVGSAAAGLLYIETEVTCLSEPGPTGCPPQDVLDMDERRPFLVPGLAGAGAITLLGAFHAFSSARDGRPVDVRTAGAARLERGASDSVLLLQPTFGTGGVGIRGTFVLPAR